MRSKAKAACPCGSGRDYAACCGRFIEQGQLPKTAEELMRSRYTAYTQFNEDYVRTTWYPRTLPEGKLIHREEGVKWTGLEVVRHAPGEQESIVEFIARYKIVGRAYKMHEVSRFVHEDGRWYYMDGQFPGREE